MKSILSLITPENLGKSIDSINKGVKIFNENVQQFGDSMSKLDKEFSDDVSKTQEHQKRESIKNQKNVEKLFGTKKSIW